MGEFRVVFTAADYDGTVAFFAETMGLEILRSFEDGGKGTILLAAEGQIEVFAAETSSGTPGVSGVALAWEVGNADQEHARIRARGGSTHGEPTMKPWGHKSFVVDGPDGWTITLFEVVVPQ